MQLSARMDAPHISSNTYLCRLVVNANTMQTLGAHGQVAKVTD